jgi:shikimate dehydrogenase
MGVVSALVGHGRPLQGAHVLLLGAGGAARAAAVACLEQGASSLTIANRTLPRAEALLADLSLMPRASGCVVNTVSLTEDALAPVLSSSSVILNATRVGLSAPDQDPLPARCELQPGQVVMDMVYRPLQTALLRRAAQSGAETIDGLWMLVHQALEQLCLWRPSEAANLSSTSPARAAFAQKLHAHLEGAAS